VIAVTHDRAFARTFDSFLIFGDDGGVRQSDEPDWAVGRVRRER
jgi:ABC-type polar amino acid transport system ATPase subunit